ncbi:MAG TPA: flavodoxin [Candidatus Choladousia intestinavium]|uniref:Flavodoxin n=1 Tax=Candidatus Choladousia intestinavium TaxID=2840727 RepID=A0A9D1ADV9_9FIRM|nr:flavodoxin [Candidatus Choladousia intestinavium]
MGFILTGEKGKVLIVSYSYSGNTYKIAEAIQKQTEGDLQEIYPLIPYPMSFPDLLEQVKREIKEKYKPRLIVPNCSPEQYDTVFVGSPNWCGTIAPPLYAWLCRNRLEGKIILPFGSHCGGVQGDMKRDVARLCRKSDVREPLILMDDGGEGLTEKVEEWLEKNSLPRRILSQDSCM